MKTILMFTALLLAGCASIPEETAAAPAIITPIDGSSLEVKKDLRFLPSLSGFYFPAGIYLPVARDEHGVFYRSPTGIRSIGVSSQRYPVGGIYRFRRSDGTFGLRSWQVSPRVGFSSRELYDMIGTNFSANVVFHE